jgi:hypothetical protein
LWPPTTRWAGVGLKGLGDARWLDNVEAIEEPDSPPQTHKPCHRQRAGTQKKTHTWLPFEVALLVLAPAESLIELATELSKVLLVVLGSG